MSSNTAVKINSLWKNFRIYHERHQTLKDTVLSKRRARFEEFWAIKDLNLEVKRGETLGVIGRNGSGKSTLLKLIGKILVPTKGFIEVNGRIAALLELGAGFESDLTGRENIYLNGSILGLSKSEVDQRFDTIVAFSELERFIDNQVKYYSSGMYLRLGFSVAVHTDPDILLVDEVLAVGDESFQKKCLDKINAFKEAGKTILFVTHDAGAARRICDRVIMLEDGSIVAHGDPAKVIRRYLNTMLVNGEFREWGTRDIEITNVELLDQDEEPSAVFLAGDPMTVRISFESKKAIEEPVIGIGIYDRRGARVAGTNTQLRGCRLGSIDGRGMIEFRFDHLPMLEGKFSLSPAIVSEDQTVVYHWQEGKYFFNVQNVNNETGVFYLPGSYRVLPPNGEVEDGKD